jgi:hypothetical protein
LQTAHLGRDHPHSKEAKSLDAKVCRILSMVGSGIPYSPFERAATRPKLNAMRFCYGVDSNFIPGAPLKFEDLLTLQLCMNPKFNDSNCYISKGFKRVNLPDQVRNESAIRMRMTQLRPFLEAQNFHHKLRILLEAVIGCKSSSAQDEAMIACSKSIVHTTVLLHSTVAVYTGILCYTRVCCLRNC